MLETKLYFKYEEINRVIILLEIFNVLNFFYIRERERERDRDTERDREREKEVYVYKGFS